MQPPRWAVVLGKQRLEGELVVLEGLEQKPLPWPTFPPSQEGQRTAAQADMPEVQLRLRLEWQERGPWWPVDVTLINLGEAQRWLEVGWRVQGYLEEAQFYGGLGVRPRGGQYSQPGLVGPFPLAALFNEAVCFALGFDPTQWLSYLDHTADLTQQPIRLRSSTRLVLDPQGEETVSFVLGAWRTPWGHREALHHYYGAFPQCFQPAPGVDPRVTLNGGSYLAWTNRPDRELCRRLQVGWEWCYAPFKRTGDILGRPEWWDYQPARPHQSPRTLSRPEYSEWRRNQFAAGRGCDVLMLFYIPSQIWCEEQLARERYADALITDPRVRTYFDQPWCTGPDNELRVFPWETSFGRQSLEDMKAVAEELNLEGFAFDTADGGGRYYGPAVNACPGRAWDERGVFVDEGVAIAKLMDWVHEQRRDGRPLAVVANPGAYATYLTCFRCDAALLENTPLTVHDGLADGLRERLGAKTMVFWETYEYPELLRDDLTREQYEDALRGFADYTVLACLREVALPTPRIALGLGPVVKWLPVLRDMARAGWQPVPAAVCPAGLWVSRAGRGLHCFLATGNETAATVASRLDVDDGWVGPGRRHLWRRWDGQPTVNVLNRGVTQVPFELPSRQPLVLQTAAAVEGEVADLKATVRWESDLHEARLVLDLEGHADNLRMTFAEPEDMRLAQVTLAGRPLRVERAGQETSVRLAWHGPSPVVATFRSTLFALSRQELLNFPWLDGEQVGFRLVARTDDPLIADAARWLADYFPYYFAHAVDPPKKVGPPETVNPEQPVEGPAVFLTVDAQWPQQHQVRLRTPQSLEVVATSPEGLKQAVKRLLAVLDERYFTAGPLPELALFQRVGLAGQQIAP